MLDRRISPSEENPINSLNRESALTNALERNRQRFSGWLSAHQERNLHLKDEDLGILIPPRLLESAQDPGKVEIVRLNEWYGRFDQEFKPALQFLIVEHGKDSSGVARDHWDDVIDTWQKRTSGDGLLDPDSVPMIFLMAHDGWSVDSVHGVEVIYLVMRSSIRNLGVGSQFYDRFETIVQEMGYDYIFGSNDETNIGFFLNRGRYKLDQLNAQNSLSALLVPEGKKGNYTTIQFLNPELEREVVDRRFLKS